MVIIRVCCLKAAYRESSLPPMFATMGCSMAFITPFCNEAIFSASATMKCAGLHPCAGRAMGIKVPDGHGVYSGVPASKVDHADVLERVGDSLKPFDESHRDLSEMRSMRVPQGSVLS